MRTIAWEAGLGLFLALAGCAAAPAPGDSAEVTLEVESLKLRDAEARPLEGAGGGKAVLFDRGSSRADGTLRLKKGTYEAVVYTQSADGDHDAFVFSIYCAYQRVYPGERNAVVPVLQPLLFHLTEDGPVEVMLRADDETGMYVDRVLVRRLN